MCCCSPLRYISCSSKEHRNSLLLQYYSDFLSSTRNDALHQVWQVMNYYDALACSEEELLWTCRNFNSFIKSRPGRSIGSCIVRSAIGKMPRTSPHTFFSKQ